MKRRENYYFFTYSPSLEKDFQHGVSIQVGGCLCVHMCMFFFFFTVEVTWEDQQRGLNGSLSDGGPQPHPSLTDAGWLVCE